jgi:hypothetical protein
MVVTYVNQNLERLLEVRCCCEPVELYGYLPYPRSDLPAAGQRIMFAVEPVDRAAPLERLVLPIATIESTLPVSTAALEPGIPRFVLAHEAHLAYKSEETPKEVFRRVSGFIAAPARMLRVPIEHELIAIVFARVSLEEWEYQIEVLMARLARRGMAVHICVGCGAVSHNPHDLVERYCGHCHRFDEQFDEAS